ncbi:MAG: hypothetical protein H6Q70_2026 [Firmicutes bacterium]|nr:hypothetical protein [Bacillota bacterium]
MLRWEIAFSKMWNINKNMIVYNEKNPNTVLLAIKVQQASCGYLIELDNKKFLLNNVLF